MAATIDDALKELRDFKEQTSSDIGWLKEQIRSNCGKLDAIKENTGILPQMYEMVQANGRGIEKISRTRGQTGKAADTSAVRTLHSA